MAKNSNEEWEFSKENILPLHQGRKAGVLKVALSHSDDTIQQQRQVFEQELRTYSGDDPLSVWCNYIKWVEQNFPKGGRDGHIEQLMQRCLSILKEEKKYYDDERFIKIWLKYATVTKSPSDVYDYMYSHIIGCQSAIFFITWAWELEQKGNSKKANQVLREGLQRKAEPYENIKSYYSDFEMRIANKVMNNPADINEEDNCRSAFSVLKPGKRKNSAPVLRTGEHIMEPGQALTIGSQQAVPKKTVPTGKVPFKIYNAENVAPTLPVQSENIAPFVLHSDLSKENEKKPSKWNKVKAKQISACPSVGNVNQDFQFHCDEVAQPATTPRSVPKVSNVLRARRDCASPQMALFEPPDPMKKPMYDKNKVYGGAEEFSLEEIRAAAWFKKQKQIEKEKQLEEQQRLLEEQQECIKNLQLEIELLKKERALQKPILSEEKDTDELSIKKSRMDSYVSNLSDQSKSSHTVRKELFPEMKLMTSYNEAAKELQELYNGTFRNPVDEILKNEYLYGKDVHESPYKHLMSGDKSAFSFGITKESTSESSIAHLSSTANQNPLSFPVYRDPTESFPLSNHKMLDSDSSTVNQNPLSFAVFRDSTESFPQSNHKILDFDSSKKGTTDFCFANLENIFPGQDNNTLPDEDAENIPPEGYIQDKCKRELNGILEPSKNIMFVPLELQEPEDEEELSSDEIINEDNQHMQDDTIIPPCNTEQFAAAPFLASTPRTHLKNAKNADLQANAAQYQSCFINDPQTTSVKTCNVASMPTISRPDTVSSEKSVDYRIATRDQSIYPCTSLSVIMESSKEGYKSSSSSGSSAGATQLSQFYSHEKSNTGRYISKMDTFKEPLPPSDFSNTFGREQVQHSSVKKETFKVHCIDVDPFDMHCYDKLLQSSILPILNGIKKSDKFSADLQVGNEITVADNTYIIMNLISSSVSGKVYEAMGPHSPTKVVLKLCKDSSEWEFYICTTLLQRLQNLTSSPDTCMSVMKVIAAERFYDGFVLVHEFCDLGTLFDLVNLYKKKNYSIPELLTMYLTWELLQTVSKMHECKIIHGDINPHNVLLQDSHLKSDFLTSFIQKTVVVKLIDFSRAVDLEFFENGACFQTPQYDYCIEMRENKPWVFQADWYGLLNCVHMLLFSESMKVKNVDSRWKIENKFSRSHDQTIWVPLFDELLNIPSCYQQPDIFQHTGRIESKLKKNIRLLKIELTQLVKTVQ